MKDDNGIDRSVWHGYGNISSRASKGALVFVSFKDGRGDGRWEDALSYQLRKILEDEGLTEAAKGVYDGFLVNTAGLGAVVQNLLKVPGGKADTTWAEDKLMAYSQWQKAVIRRWGMQARQDSIDVICHDKPLAQIDSERRQKHGTAKIMLLNCLMLYENT